MAYVNAVSKTEPVEPPADSGALDLSVSSPRRAPSASDRREHSPPGRNFHSPSEATGRQASLPSSSEMQMHGMTTNQLHFSNQRPSSSTQRTPSVKSGFTDIPLPQSRHNPSHSAPKSPRSSGPPSSSQAQLPALALDMEKLRSVQLLTQNRQHAAGGMNQHSRHSVDGVRPKVPHSNNSRVPTNQVVKPPPVQSVRPSLPSDSNEVAVNPNPSLHPAVAQLNNNRHMNIQHANPSVNPEAQLLPSNSFLRIQPSGVLNWGGQPVQLVTNFRLQGSNKVPNMAPGGQMIANPGNPTLLKIAPDSLVDHQRLAQQGGVVMQNRIQPKSMPRPRENSVIMPAPNGNGANNIRPAPTNAPMMDNPMVSMAVQQARTVFQKQTARASEQFDAAASSAKVAAGKIPSPPSQVRYSQTHRPIMPKPSRQTGPPPQQPVLYICTIPPTAPSAVQQSSNIIPIKPNANTADPSIAADVKNVNGSPPSATALNGAQISVPTVASSSSSSSNCPSADITVKLEGDAPTPQPSAHPTVTTSSPKKNAVQSVVAFHQSPPKLAPTNTDAASPLKAAKRKTKPEETAAKRPKENASPFKTEVAAPKVKSTKAAEKKPKKTKPQIVTHVIDGFVILESDRPFSPNMMSYEVDEAVADGGADTGALPQKRRRRASSAASRTSATSTVASGKTTSSQSQSKCHKCKRAIPPPARGVKNYSFKGNRLCGFPCFSQVRHEYATSSHRQKRKFNAESSAAGSPRVSPDNAPSHQVQHDGQPRNSSVEPPHQAQRVTHYTSPTKATATVLPAASAPFLMSPLPVPSSAAVSSPGTPSNSAVTKPANQWSVADVNEFVKGIPGCEEAAQKFLEQEIDGPALLLLKSDVMVQLMGLKIGPVLKIQSRLNAINHQTSTVGSSPPSASRPALSSSATVVPPLSSATTPQSQPGAQAINNKPPPAQAQHH